MSGAAGDALGAPEVGVREIDKVSIAFVHRLDELQPGEARVADLA